MTETATRVAASTESHTARIDLGSHSSLQEIGVVITDLGIVLRDPPGSSFFETQSPGPQARVKQIRYRNPLEITIELASGTMNWTPLAVVALALFFGRGPEERAKGKTDPPRDFICRNRLPTGDCTGSRNTRTESSPTANALSQLWASWRKRG